VRPDPSAERAYRRPGLPITASRMARTSRLLCVGAMLAFGALAYAASEIKLEDGNRLTVSQTESSRILPHTFYDQAISSLPHLFPTHVLLAGRRSGVLGDVEYALVCFKETPASEQAVFRGIAVQGDRAWHFEATAPASAFGVTLMQILEQIEKLSSGPGARPTPVSSRITKNGR
jgi:hypothetical protein